MKLLTQFQAWNDEKYFNLWKLDISKIEFYE